MHIVGHSVQPFVTDAFAAMCGHGLVRVAHDGIHCDLIAAFDSLGLKRVPERVEPTTGRRRTSESISFLNCSPMPSVTHGLPSFNARTHRCPYFVMNISPVYSETFETGRW